MRTYTIQKTSGLTLNELYKGLDEGGKIVIYGYCISLLAVTLRRISPPHYIKPGERPSKYGLRYNLRSLILGWWGLPWGPVYTIDMIKINLKNGGGVDITDDILTKLVQKFGTLTNNEIFSEDITIDFDDNELVR